jgi:hypothetical protein
MDQNMIRKILRALGLVAFFYSLTFTSSQLFSDETVSYDRDIRPILAENCFSCHGFDDKTREANLRLDTRQGAVDEGKVILVGQTEKSPLLERVHSTDADLLMPPPESGKKLSDEQKKLLKRWIDQGAVYEQHWAFRKPTKKELPVVEGLQHPVDLFVRQKLMEHHLTPSELAKPSTLIRRASLDLIGLPPSPQEIEDFETAAAQDLQKAYNELLNRLLASPHFGERWGRWWLDQARYADSHGYSIDAEREIWKYRDWVITAFNENKSFDQFTIEQLGGDLLPGATVNQKIATGFHRNTQINQEGGIDPEQFRMDSIFDRVATTGNVWLGLSIGCAQCHTHKFDPITQKEYYQLFAFLNNQDETSIKVYPEEVNADQLGKERSQLEGELTMVWKEHEAAFSKWEKELTDEQRKALPEQITKLLAIKDDKRKVSERSQLLIAAGIGKNHDLSTILARISAIDTELNKGVSTLVLSERKAPRDTFILIKGDFTRPDEKVQPGTLSVLHPLQSQNANPNRLDFANWLVSLDNPLTSRVIANRVWQQLFGKGIVETENDFGLQGTSPSHPELLDWLAVDFRESGWNFKELLRTIMTSHTYMQSSTHRQDLATADPLNTYLAKQNRLRLEAEIVRDVALSASGLLTPKLYGPPVRPPIPEGIMTVGQSQRKWVASQGEDRYRRAIYTFLYRVTPPPALNVFDAPDGLSSCTRRIRSNTPLQALTLLNDPAFFEFALAMDKRIQQEGLETCFIRCTSRKPSAEELKLIGSLDSLNAARALLNLDETLNRE